MRTTLPPFRPTALFAAGIALAIGLSACSGTTASDPTTPAASPSMSAPMESASPMPDTTAVMPMGTGDPFADARTAAQHMPETAATLAGGFAAALQLPGDVKSPAADLRAGLTSLLQEHTYLAGIAVATAYTAGADSAEFKAAAATLDANSVALSKAVGSLSDAKHEKAFLELWRAHIGNFVTYAVATKGGDAAGAKAAVKDLMAYTKSAGGFFEEVSGGKLPAAAIAKSLEGHIATLTKAIDDLAAGSPNAYASLQAAAHHVVGGATVIAGGLDAAAKLDGDPMDKASTLRTDLTAALQEHVYLASIAVFTAYTSEGGTDSAAFKAAAGVLDKNSVALSEAIGTLAGKDKGTAFLELWRKHIGFFVDYANAVATDDDAAATKALVSLDGYRGEAGTFFEDISGGKLPADAVAEGLAMHVQTLAGAIDSLDKALVEKS